MAMIYYHDSTLEPYPTTSMTNAFSITDNDSVEEATTLLCAVAATNETADATNPVALDRAVVLVNMVTENKAMFTNRQYQRVKFARRAYEMVGRPSVRDFKRWYVAACSSITP